jgi:hypothetical protein
VKKRDVVPVQPNGRPKKTVRKPPMKKKKTPKKNRKKRNG